MSEPDFHELYDLLVEATGSTPGRTLQTDLEQLYERHPVAYRARVDEVIAGFVAGRIHNPWPFLRSSLRRLDTHRPVAESSGAEREKAIHLAERWLHNAGLYAPLDEALHELYDARSAGHKNSDHALLAYWKTEPQLRQRMIDYWQAQQPRAEHAQRLYAEHNAKAAAGYFAQLEAKRGDAPPKPASDERPPWIFDDTEPEPE